MRAIGETVKHEVRELIPAVLYFFVAFNIIGFGSTFEALFKECLPYDEHSLLEASGYVESLQADLGGTEIRSAVEFALEELAHARRPAAIVLGRLLRLADREAEDVLVDQHDRLEHRS